MSSLSPEHSSISLSPNPDNPSMQRCGRNITECCVLSPEIYSNQGDENAKPGRAETSSQQQKCQCQIHFPEGWIDVVPAPTGEGQEPGLTLHGGGASWFKRQAGLPLKEMKRLPRLAIQWICWLSFGLKRIQPACWFSWKEVAAQGEAQQRTHFAFRRLIFSRLELKGGRRLSR